MAGMLCLLLLPACLLMDHGGHTAWKDGIKLRLRLFPCLLVQLDCMVRRDGYSCPQEEFKRRNDFPELRMGFFFLKLERRECVTSFSWSAKSSKEIRAKTRDIHCLLGNVHDVVTETKN